MAKRLIVSRFFKKCDFFLAISDSNEAYLKYFGVRPRNITRVPFPVDMGFWNGPRAIKHQQRRHLLRENLGIGPDDTVYMFAGKLVAHKRPEDVIRAFAELNQTNTYLLIIGNGEESRKLKALVKEYSLSERAMFFGFVNQGELPELFACSDILVFPSEFEPYGAIAAEVLPFGLAIIASDVVGAMGGPIQPGLNALVYPATHVQRLADCMLALHQNKSQLQSFSDYSRTLADSQDARFMAHSISNFCQSSHN